MLKTLLHLKKFRVSNSCSFTTCNAHIKLLSAFLILSHWSNWIKVQKLEDTTRILLQIRKELLSCALPFIFSNILCILIGYCTFLRMLNLLVFFFFLSARISTLLYVRHTAVWVKCVISYFQYSFLCLKIDKLKY